MSIPNPIKIKDEFLDASIKLILNIKDQNIFFSKYAVTKERVQDHWSTVYTGILTYQPPKCACCGFDSVVRHSYKKSDIQLIKVQENYSYLRLYKQRFLCKNCGTTFTAKTYYVDENCYISKPLKFAIAVALKEKKSMKDIATEYGVSSKTVERILHSFYKEPQLNTHFLPKHLLIDEFKGTSDCEGAMCFIISDADTGKIFDILDDRRNFKIERYFMRFPLKVRQKVAHIVMDMNGAYGSIISKIFPKVKISIDRFHIIQQINRALNTQRIKTMKSLNRNDSEEMKDYRKLKKYWKTLLKNNKNIDYTSYKQFPLFNKKLLTESDVLDHLLSIDTTLKESYEIYQELLYHYDKRDHKAFFATIENLPRTLDEQFKKSICYLIKHKTSIKHSFLYPYSNGKMEGKNNLIKVIKRIAFGFRTFRTLKMRIFIQQDLFTIIK